MKKNGWNPVDLRDTRYNQILHMVSAANGAEAFYSTEVSNHFSYLFSSWIPGKYIHDGVLV